jgi:type II secretory pathway pseudopilin PulG
MSGALWFVGVLAVAALSVLVSVVAEWRASVRRAKRAGRAARAFLAEMGRHNLPETGSSAGNAVAGRPSHVSVNQLLQRVEREGYAVRLNWRRDDEQRARQGEGGSDPGDFPTAVLPRIED